MVIKMNINKTHYKVLSETKKIYLDMTTLEIRQKLNVAFKTPTAEDDMTGISGKFVKLDKLYKVKYIHSRDKQMQPQTFDRYHYLLDVGEDEKGAYVEYVMVYDKLYNPLTRLVYIFAVCAVIAYLYFQYINNNMSSASAILLSSLLVASIALVFKKTNESEEKCKNAEIFIENLLKELE